MVLFNDKLTEAFIKEDDLVVTITDKTELLDALVKTTKIKFDDCLLIIGVDSMDRPTCRTIKDSKRSRLGYKTLTSYYYPSEEKMILNISGMIDRVNEVKESKKKRKEIAKTQKEEVLNNLPEYIKEGDVFYSSWGYEQTNVDFYQIIKVKGQTTTIRKVISEIVSGTEGSMCSNVKPVVDQFCGDEIKKRINISGKHVSVGTGYRSLSKYTSGDNGVYTSSYY